MSIPACADDVANIVTEKNVEQVDNFLDSTVINDEVWEVTNIVVDGNVNSSENLSGETVIIGDHVMVPLFPQSTSAQYFYYCTHCDNYFYVAGSGTNYGYVSDETRQVLVEHNLHEVMCSNNLGVGGLVCKDCDACWFVIIANGIGLVRTYPFEPDSKPMTGQEIAAISHHGLTHVPAKGATQNSAGNIEYWYCPSCGKYYSDASTWNEISSSSVIVWYANPFNDVTSSASYYNAVMWAYTNGIVKGTSATTFSPNADCTRGQFALMLYRLAGKPDVTGVANPFKDVKSSSAYYKAILWAYSEGIIKGTSATTFNPNGTVTRGQIVLMLYRMVGKPAVTNTTNPFTDVSKSDSCYRAVLWAVEKGITKGTSATTFSPNNPCTRYQLVLFLYRYNNIMGYI